MPVYFIGNGIGHVKIGHSSNPIARLSNLQTASPHKLELLAVAPGAEKTESELHYKFSAYRLEGEWFHLSDSIKAEIEIVRTYHSRGEDYRPDADDRRIWEDAFADFWAETERLNEEYDSKIELLEREIERLEEERDRKEEMLDQAFDEKTKDMHPWWILKEKDER